MNDDFDLIDQPEAISAPPQIPYLPRPHFRALHASDKRWIFCVAHRRAGKTVALVNQLIRAALSNPRRHPPPRYAYVGPSFDQVKDLCWGYLKHYTQNYPGIRYLEGELTVIFPTGATIRLYGGGQAYERIRGIYLDGAVLDEYPLLNPRAWTSVVRPTLADYRGFAIISGTSNGDDHFHAVKLKAEDDPQWDVFDIKITDTANDALSAEEIADLTRDMPSDEYAREMLNAFDAPIEGAYYTEAMNALQQQNRIASVPVDLSQSLITGWDIGVHDFTCVWILQLAGRSIHFVDYVEDHGHKASHYLDILDKKAKAWGTGFKAHILPHDVEAREWISGQSRKIELMDMTPTPILTAPRVSDPDGISAVRGILGVAWFDAQRCRRGLARLRGYKRSKFGTPVHDDHCVHPDTLLLTRNGTECIKDLSEIGEVWTPCGWRPYSAPRMTRRNVPLVEVAFQDGHTVKCTEDHLFLTASGWKFAASLRSSSRILSSLTPSPSFSMAAFSGSIPASVISLMDGEGCTTPFGKGFTGVASRIAMFITGMAFRATMALKTSKSFLLPSIFGLLEFTGMGSPAIMLASAPLNGIGRRRGGFGIAIMRAERRGLARGKSASAFAAESLSWDLSGRAGISTNFALKPVGSWIAVKSVRRLEQRSDVWCLTVDDPMHWWSLANGAVTHNSHGADAMKTVATGLQLVTALSSTHSFGSRLRRRIRGLV